METRKIFNDCKCNKVFIFFIFFILVIFVPEISFAARAIPFAPSETLDPECRPLESNCYVQPFVVQDEGVNMTNFARGLNFTGGGVQVTTNNEGIISVRVTRGASSFGEFNWNEFRGSGVRLATSTYQVLVGANSTTSLAKLEVVGDQVIRQGNLGVGTTSPWRELSVVGQGYFTGALTASRIITNGNGTSTFSNGINVQEGCIAIQGECIGIGGGAGNPAGSNRHIQYNKNGSFGAESAFIYNDNTNTLSADNAIFSGTTTLGNLTISQSGGERRAILTSDSFLFDTQGTSTLGAGLNITSGCFSVGGVCVGQGSVQSIGRATLGQIAIWNDAQNITSTSSLYWDSARNRLGINNTSPNRALSVTGGVDVSGEVLASRYTASSASVGYQIGGVSVLRTPGTQNVLIGQLAAQNIGSGVKNTGIGYNSISSLVSGSSNVAIGESSLATNVDGGQNVAIGVNSLYFTQGSGNVAIGYQAGFNVDQGTNNIFIGTNSGVGGSGLTNRYNAVAIGTGATAEDNNVFVLGGVSSNKVNVGVGTFKPNARLQVVGESGDSSLLFNISSSTASFATSSIFSIDRNGVLAYTGFATSTFNNGIDIGGGCFSVNGNCVAGPGVGGTPAGSNRHIQFNQGGSFASDSAFTFNRTTDTLEVPNIISIGTTSLATTTVAMLSVLGSSTSTFAGGIDIQSGCLSVAGVCVTGPTVSISGSNRNVQFNDSGVFGSDPTFNFNKNTKTLIIQNINSSGTSSLTNLLFSNATGTSFSVGSFNVTGSGTTTYSGGIDLINGCIAISGNCIRTGIGAPGGNNRQVQFNNNGVFDGDAGFTYNTNTKVFSANKVNVLNDVTTGSLNFATSTGGSATTTNFSTSNLSVTGNSTTTFSSGIQTSLIRVNGSATSSFVNGINISGGCFSVNGVCILGTSGAGAGVGTINAGNTGRLPYYTSATTLSPANSIFVDGNNTRLGIGNLNPQDQLDMSGNIRLSETIDSSTGVIKKGVSHFIHDFGDKNTFVGELSGNFTLSGGSNTGIGWGTLASLTTGTNNVALGDGAMHQNQSGRNNFALGSNALTNSVSSSNNVAIGTFALMNTSSDGNTAIGYLSLLQNTTGAGNLGIGVRSLTSNTNGSGNVAIGNSSLMNLSTTSNNVSIGLSSGISNLGGNNTFVGANTGILNTYGENNTFLGFSSGQSSNPLIVNSTAIGANSNVTASNTLALGDPILTRVVIGTTSPEVGIKLHVENQNGDSSILVRGYEAGGARIYLDGGNNGGVGSVGDFSVSLNPNGNRFSIIENLNSERAFIQSGVSGWQTPSDSRLKTNIQVLGDVLSKLNEFSGVRFDLVDGKTSQIGVVAQDIQKVFPELVSESENGLLGVNYGALSAIAIQGVKELNEKITAISSNLPSRDEFTQGIIKYSDNGIIFVKNVSFESHLSANKDTVGVVRIKVGETSARYNFLKSYQRDPVVIVTPQQKISSGYFVTTDKDGFIVNIDQAENVDISFGFVAFMANYEEINNEIIPENEVESEDGAEPVTSEQHQTQIPLSQEILLSESEFLNIGDSLQIEVAKKSEINESTTDQNENNSD